MDRKFSKMIIDGGIIMDKYIETLDALMKAKKEKKKSMISLQISFVLVWI